MIGTFAGLAIALMVFIFMVGDIRLIQTYIYDDSVVFTRGMGDILFWQSEYIAPVPQPDEILSVHRLQLDDIGFRLPATPATTYEAVILGDSFTEGANVGLPYPDIFARTSGLSTRNLGFRGYGIRHYLWTWQQYGIAENPDVLIIGFFGGNDLFTAGLDLEPPFRIPNEERAFDAPTQPITENIASDTVIYPVYLANDVPLTFLSTYISWMNVTEATIVQSVNYQVIAETLSNIQQSASGETCLIFAYLPSKPEVYFPYLNVDDYPAILEGQKHVLLNSDGTLHIVEDFDISVEKVIENRFSTGNALTTLADDLGYNAINLHSVFDEQAADGEMLYYTYDTHWNQSGQTLAGETLAEYVNNTCTDL